MAELTEEQKREFVEAIYAAAVEVASSGSAIIPAVVAAQAAIESRYGDSALAKQANNLFGIKSGKRWKGKFVVFPTQEWDHDLQVMVTVEARFKAFDSWKDCIVDYARIIESYSWFRDCVTAAKNGDPVAYVEGLITRPGEPGWATDPKYSTKIYKVIAMWGLLNR